MIISKENRAEKTLEIATEWAFNAANYLQERNLEKTAEFQKEPRRYTQKEAAAYLRINVKTLKSYVNELGIDPTDEENNHASWSITIDQLYQLYDYTLEQVAAGKKINVIPLFKRAPSQNPIRISLNNQKGGCGKTVAAVNVASGIATEYRQRFRVLLVDTDPQSNASQYYAPGASEQDAITATDLMLDNYELDEGETFKDVVKQACLKTTIPNLDILPASQSDRSIEDLRLFVKNHDIQNPFGLLDNILNQVEDDYDIIIIDTPPATNVATFNAYYAANGVILPVSPEAHDLQATAGYLNFFTTLVSTLRDYGHPGFAIMGVLLTNFSNNSVGAQQNRAELTRMVGSAKYEAGIVESEAIRTLANEDMSVFDVSQSQYPRTKQTFMSCKTNLLGVIDAIMSDIFAEWKQQESGEK